MIDYIIVFLYFLILVSILLLLYEFIKYIRDGRKEKEKSHEKVTEKVEIVEVKPPEHVEIVEVKPPEEITEDKATAKFEVYTDKAGEYRFRLKAPNGEIIVASSEGYKTKQGCMNGIKSVKKNVLNPKIIEL